jgi:4-methoxybenzoate monooxygenase (O-demethylating)
VLLLLGSANRDPEKWENAETYDISRVAAGHVGYGAGVHVCAGQLLARLEGEALLTALAKHITRIEQIGEPVRAFNNTLRGLSSLPVRLL